MNDDMTTKPEQTADGCIQCGGPMSRNPHPQAGKIPTLLVVGAVYECIPCLVNSRHSWRKMATAAERECDALREVIQKIE